MQEHTLQPSEDRPFRFGAAHVTEVLGDMRFPASREHMVLHAQTRGARPDVIEFLRRMPDLPYQNLDQVLGMANTLEQEAA